MLEYFSSIDSEDAFRRMCVLDALTYNPDRHYGNFGVLFDADTMQNLGMAPVYGNNRSLFPELDEDQLQSPESGRVNRARIIGSKQSHRKISEKQKSRKPSHIKGLRDLLFNLGLFLCNNRTA